ncbi:MAG TPA: ABC transporter ATP-binding protein [Ktedonobacteraceae bacterium]|nr:ABC transporter ATP-binding protein [Ktedonobacteraceae bacterium]
MATIIQTNHLTKSYGKSRGIIDVTFAIQEGEVFGFLGPNGAGKTTTMRVLMGLLRANSGNATIGGLDCWQNSTEVKKLVGYLPGEFTFDPGLRGAQIIEYLGHLRGGVDQAYVRELVERLGFDPGKRFREYSHGNKQKLGLVQAFMHKPRLLILDEPTSGLDPLNQQEFYKMVAEVHAEGHTVLLSSHILPEVEQTCDRVAIIREGRLIKTDHVSALKNIRQHEVEIAFAGPASVEWFKNVAGIVKVAPGADERTLQLNVQGELTETIQIASQHGATNIVTHEPSLEEVFLHFYEPEQSPAALAGER